MSGGASGIGIRFLSEYDTEEPSDSSVSLGQYKNLRVSAKAAGKQKEDELISALLSGSEIKVSPHKIEGVALKMAEEFANRLSRQGLSVEQYYEITGLDAAGLVKQMLPSAQKRVEGRLVLQAVARAEHLEAEEKEYTKEINRLSAMYLIEAEEIKGLVAGKEEKQIKADITIHKALEFLLESAVEESN